MAFVEKLVGWIWGIPLIVTILGTGLYLTLSTGCFQFAKFGHILKSTFGNLLKKDKGAGEGLISPFQAISIAVGGTVGVGNIAGVATAIAVGGPGAVFWMWVAALFGMLIKTAEVTLAVYYRQKDENGHPYGGPTYYMQKGLGEERGLKFWPILAVIFGAGIFSTFFLTLQNYSVSEAVGNTFGVNLVVISVIYVIMTYIIIAGGIPKLGEIAGNLVPFMCIFYIVGGLIIIVKYATSLPSTFGLIFSGAFNGTAAVGGFAGAAFAQTIRLGMARAVYSNEAGWGTSPMIHASARTDHPVKQGIWGAFEVFVDTILVCSITALVIILTGEWSSGVSGATLTLNAFEVGIGRVGRVVVAISVFLFGLTTTTGWYAYYEVLLRHLFKKNLAIKDKILAVYKWVYPIPGMLLVILSVKNALPGPTVWMFGDLTSGIPTFANVIAILILSPTFFKLVKDYKARYLGIGKVDPNFKLFYEDKVKSSK